MTIPKIELVAGDRNTEFITLRCTGCAERYIYSVRQYKGDFGCNISEFEQFLDWAKHHAAQHECFLAGRVGYIEDPLAYHVDFPQVEPEVEDSLYAWLNGEDYWPPLDDDDDDPPSIEPDCLTCGARSWTFVDGDCPKCNPPIISDNCSVCRSTGPHDTCNPPIEDDDLDAWMDEELDLPPLPFACGIGDSVRFYATGPTEEPDPDIGVDDDRLGWEENRFDFLYGKPTEFKTYGTVTGRITAQHPTLQEIPRLHSFPPIEIDYAELEQRAVDAYLVALGIYTRDSAGNLRDEKGRCLTCIRSHDRIMEGRK